MDKIEEFINSIDEIYAKIDIGNWRELAVNFDEACNHSGDEQISVKEIQSQSFWELYKKSERESGR